MTKNLQTTGHRAWQALILLTATTVAWVSAADDHDVHRVALFPANSDSQRQGFVRVINHQYDAGDVTIQAIDDTGYRADEVTLSIDSRETIHFNSEDLELGNSDKGLSDGTGMGQGGDWRLELTSDLDIEVLAYIRTTDGFLTSMFDTVPAEGLRHRVAVFNPGSNTNQVSVLRVINDGREDADLEIVGIDDAGNSPETPVEATVPAGEVLMLSAQELEQGGGDLEGLLGDGTGKWRLNVTAHEPVTVLSLIRNARTGHITNLSAAADREILTFARDVYNALISRPIVQSKCIHCHIHGGQSAHTPLVFVLSSVEDYRIKNFKVFSDYLTPPEEELGNEEYANNQATRILEKIQGNLGHGGGPQIESDTDDFRNMERFVTLLAAEIEENLDQ